MFLQRETWGQSRRAKKIKCRETDLKPRLQLKFLKIQVKIEMV